VQKGLSEPNLVLRRACSIDMDVKRAIFPWRVGVIYQHVVPTGAAPVDGRSVTEITIGAVEVVMLELG